MVRGQQRDDESMGKLQARDAGDHATTSTNSIITVITTPGDIARANTTLAANSFAVLIYITDEHY